MTPDRRAKTKHAEQHKNTGGCDNFKIAFSKAAADLIISGRHLARIHHAARHGAPARHFDFSHAWLWLARRLPKFFERALFTEHGVFTR